MISDLIAGICMDCPDGVLDEIEEIEALASAAGQWRTFEVAEAGIHDLTQLIDAGQAWDTDDFATREWTEVVSSLAADLEAAMDEDYQERLEEGGYLG